MNRFVGAAIVSALAIGAAHAQQGAGGWHGGGGGGGMMRSADANGDGVVTRAEYQAAVDARFARMDTNGDGVLSADEQPRRGMHGGGDEAAPPTANPAAASAGMTRDQFRARAMRRFDAMDTNHDGKIDATEMQAMMGQYRRGPAGGATPAPAPSDGTGQ